MMPAAVGAATLRPAPVVAAPAAAAGVAAPAVAAAAVDATAAALLLVHEVDICTWATLQDAVLHFLCSWSFRLNLVVKLVDLAHASSQAHGPEEDSASSHSFIWSLQQLRPRAPPSKDIGRLSEDFCCKRLATSHTCLRGVRSSVAFFS